MMSAMMNYFFVLVDHGRLQRYLARDLEDHLFVIVVLGIY
jgi:hypothetical protein